MRQEKEKEKERRRKKPVGSKQGGRGTYLGNPSRIGIMDGKLLDPDEIIAVRDTLGNCEGIGF
jgi:hypothetical protein